MKYNNLFQFQLYIKGNISQKVLNIFSFEENDIFNSLPNIYNIKIEKIFTTIFTVKCEIVNILEVQSLTDSKPYSLELELNSDHYNKIKEKTFLWINYHQLKKDKIVTNKLTTFEILNDQKPAKIFNYKSL